MITESLVFWEFYAISIYVSKRWSLRNIDYCVDWQSLSHWEYLAHFLDLEKVHKLKIFRFKWDRTYMIFINGHAIPIYCSEVIISYKNISGKYLGMLLYCVTSLACCVIHKLKHKSKSVVCFLWILG